MDFPRRELECFVAIAASGSLGRAVSQLNLTQPTLSRIVKEMETRLGQPLFERHTRGMALTAAGEALLPLARQLIYDMDQATEAMDALRGLSRGTARIGAVAAAARSILPTAIGRLFDSHPALRVTVLEAPEDRLLAALADREVDLIIAAQVPPTSEVVTSAECRFDDEYSVFCAASHPLSGQLPLARVLQEQWAMPGGGSTPRLLFEELAAMAGQPAPNVAVETGSLGAMVSFVAHTKLLGWLPRPLLTADEAAGTIRLLDVAELAIRRRFFLYRRRSGLLPRAAQRLRECLPLLS